MEKRVYARYLIGLLLFGVGLLCFSTVRFMLLPIFFAALLTVILIPISNWLLERGLSKNISSFLAVGIIIGALFLIVYILTIPLLKSAKEFLISFPSFLFGVQNRLGITKVFSTLGITDVISDSINVFIGELFGVEKVLSFMFGAVKWLYVFFLTPIFCFYMLRDRRNIQKSLVYFIPFETKGELSKLFREIYLGISTYVYGYLFISLICMGAALLSFAVIDLDSFLFLAFFMGACSFIPFIGPFIGGIPALIVASNYGWKLWYVMFAIVLIFQFAGSVLTPKTIGNSVNVHPIFGILAMVLGYGIFGVIGIVLAVPVFVIVRPVIKYIFTIITTN